MKAAFLTYNSVGQSGTYPNGVVTRNGHQAIIVQHSKGKSWGADDLGALLGKPTDSDQTRTEEERKELKEIRDTRSQLVSELYSEVFGQSELPDYVVVYVGAGGSEGAIGLAATAPHDRVCFVMCDCNLDIKRRLVASYGMSSARIVMCSCGGQHAMGSLVERFLNTGSL